MTEFERLLQSLIDEHQRIGSPVDRYLRRPGRDAANDAQCFQLFSSIRGTEPAWTAYPLPVHKTVLRRVGRILMVSRP